MQMPLVLENSSSTIESFDIPDAELSLHHGSFCPEASDRYLQTLLTAIPWKQDFLIFGGRKVAVPRLQAWYGDQHTHYGYSGLKLQPRSWTPLLLDLKTKVEKISGTSFNSVLINYYRNGLDSVAWHSDNEKELGQNPLVASLSFGASRRFELKHKTNKAIPTIHCELHRGSLLIMGSGLQQHWLHRLPKQKEIQLPRINLTFRKILPHKK